MCFDKSSPLEIVYLFKPQNIYNVVTPDRSI